MTGIRWTGCWPVVLVWMLAMSWSGCTSEGVEPGVESGEPATETAIDTTSLRDAGAGSADAPAQTDTVSSEIDLATATPDEDDLGDRIDIIEPGSGDGGVLDTAGSRDQAPSAPGESDRGAACSGRQDMPSDATLSLVVDGLDREYHVHVPPTYDPGVPSAIVLNFHGFFSDPQEQMEVTGMNAKADREGFVAVHPTGVGQSWNAGACCGAASIGGVDDVGFVDAVLDDLESMLCVDERRIFATGFSNGGFFTHRLGCELAHRIAAIAPVSGGMLVPTCEPARPVSVLHIHGNDDPIVPYEGGTFLRSAGDSVVVWSEADGCVGEPETVLAEGTTTCRAWTDCDAAAEVQLCTIDGWGHLWPGGPAAPFGGSEEVISATDRIWAFFEAHPMP